MTVHYMWRTCQNPNTISSHSIIVYTQSQKKSHNIIYEGQTSFNYSLFINLEPEQKQRSEYSVTQLEIAYTFLRNSARERNER